MKKIILLLTIFIICLTLFSQQNKKILVDCIHGANYTLTYGYFQDIHFENIFSDYDVTVITANSIPFDSILIDEVITDSLHVSYTIDLPGIYLERPIALYVIITPESDDNWLNATGTITNPDSIILAEMFNNILHFDNCIGNGWTINLNLSSATSYNIKIGYGKILFSSNGFDGEYCLNNYDAVIRIKEEQNYVFQGYSPEYSSIDLSAFYDFLSAGKGFLNIYNIADDIAFKPFVHFYTSTRQSINFKLTLNGKKTLTSPEPVCKGNKLIWNNYSLNTNTNNEMLWEAIINNRLNFLYFDIISDKHIITQNNISYKLYNIKLLKYINDGNYIYASINELMANENKELHNWQTYSTQELKYKMQQEFYNEALNYGLTQEEAQHFVYSFLWIESLLRRAYDKPKHYFGFYNFSNELYNKLFPVELNIKPNSFTRNMWVMLSNIQNKEKQNPITFPEFTSLNNKNKTTDIDIREYGVVDEYYSRKNYSNEDDFFEVEFNNYIPANNLYFYDNDITNTITHNITENINLQDFAGCYTFNVDNYQENGIAYSDSIINYPVIFLNNIYDSAKQIVLGTSKLFSGENNDSLFINNCMDYLCGNLSDISELENNFNLQLTNYPNPFKDETKILFYLPAKSIVKLDIYNTNGQKITTLLNHTLQKGKHSIYWDGKATNGSNVSNGIYFYRLKSKQNIASGRFMYVK